MIINFYILESKMILLNIINIIVKFREQETTSNYFVAFRQA